MITAHLIMVVYHKHTQYPGPGRTENNVVGYPLLPVYTAKAGGFFFVVFGITVLLSAVATINPVWLFGPYNPSQITAGSQPDWYIGFLDGMLRIMPPLGDDGVRAHDQLEHPVPGADPAGHHVHAARALPVHRGLGHRRQARAPPARPAAQPGHPHRHRRHGHHLLHPAVGGRRQRHHRDALRRVDQRDDLVLPDRRLRAAADRLRHHQAHLPRPAAPRPRPAPARPRDRRHPSAALR